MRIIKGFIGVLSVGLIIWCAVMAVDAYRRQSDTEAVAKEAFDLINEYRVEKGLSTLVWDDALAREAVNHSTYMNETDDYRHSEYAKDYGCAENILYDPGGGFPSGNSIVIYWKMSREHNLNLLDHRLKSGAVGVAGKYATFLAK